MTTFTPPHPNWTTYDELIANRLAAIKARAVQYHQPGAFRPITHWAELTRQSEDGSIEE